MAQIGVEWSAVMVGREREQTMLRQQFADTLRGQGRLVLVGGAAGIGKTTLVQSLADEARERGALVLTGHCNDFGTTPPYGPWAEIASAYRDMGALPLFPVALRDDQRSLDAGYDTRLEGGQESLFAEISDFIATISGARPLILLLEDMHWSDAVSLDLLRSLSRRIAALRLLLVVTYRSDELVRRHPLYQLLPRLVRDAGARRIDVRPLASDAQRVLVAARYHLPPADHERLARYVHSHAEGNPLYIRELFGAFEEHGILQTSDAGWVLGDLRHMRVPALVRQLIDERLARLDEETRDLLAAAAVIGQEAPLDLWQRVGDASADRFDAVVTQALEAGLIEESLSGNGWRFSHALIREALYEGVILTRRRMWHRRVAEAMERLPQPDPDAVAYHYQQAGDARAAGWLVRAGERAQRAYALLIAADRFEAAAALTQGDAARDRERGWLLYRAGRAVVSADGARALACLEEAERIGVAMHDAALAAYALSDRGLVRCFLGEPRRGIAEMEAGVRALDALPEDETPTGSAIAAWIVGTAAGTEGVLQQRQPDGSSNGEDLRRAQLALWYGVAGRYREAEAHALALIARDPEAHDDAWAGLGYASVAAGRPAAARQAWQRARAAYHAHGRRWPAASIALEELDSVCLAYDADDRDERERIAAEAEQSFRRARGGFAAPDFARTARLPLLLLEGEWAKARQVAEDLSLFPSVAQRYHRYVLGTLSRHQGRPREAWASVRAALPTGLASEPGDSLFHEAMDTMRLAAELALDEGDVALARRWLEMHSRWLAWSGAVRRQSEDSLAWARYHRAAGDQLRARQHAEAAVAHAREPRQPLALLAALRMVGKFEAEDGQRGAADEHLREALALADACGARYERALTLLALADLRATDGRQAEASTLLEEARATLVALAAAPALARADALAARIGAVAIQASLPAGLTAREADVLRLLAVGKSNKEIANALSVSVRTAERHIANLYTKIDATGRAEAIAFAHRHGLI